MKRRERRHVAALSLDVTAVIKHSSPFLPLILTRLKILTMSCTSAFYENVYVYVATRIADIGIQSALMFHH